LEKRIAYKINLILEVIKIRGYEKYKWECKILGYDCTYIEICVDVGTVLPVYLVKPIDPVGRVGNVHPVDPFYQIDPVGLFNSCDPVSLLEPVKLLDPVGRVVTVDPVTPI